MRLIISINVNENKDFTLEGLKKENFFREKFRFLPYPNDIAFKNNYFILGKNIKISTVDINPSHDLVKQFSRELAEDFNLSINFNDAKELSEIPEVPTFKKDRKKNKESYIIYTKKGKILLESKALHGLFNAFQTLRQILINGKRVCAELERTGFYIIPELEIQDWPALEMRGVADDVSRGQIPTVESAKRFIKKISQYKNNYYAFYIEDVFKCSKHPKVGENRGAFTPNELIELDKYAKSRFVKLFPILETLGHMDNILTLPEYEDLGEFPGAQSFAVANGNIYPFLRAFIEEMSPCFSSNIFHLGGDETFDLGHGKSKDLLNVVGMDGALFDHYMKLYNIAKRNGNEKIILYHDIVAKYPDIIKKFPDDVLIMYWDYIPKEHYKKLKMLKEMGANVIVSPSMLCWTRHFPDYTNASNNIIQIIEDAKEMGLIGQLNSTWGDFANQNLRPNNIYGPILSGSASWTQEKIEYKSFLEDMGSLFFQFPIDDSSEHFSSVFDSLVNLKEFYRKKISLLPQPFYRYLYKHPFIDSDSKPFLKQHEELSKKAGGCIEELEQLEKKAKDNGFYFQYLIFSAELAQLLAKKDDMRVFVNSNLGSLKKDEICRKIEKFKKKAQQIFTRYESLWLYAAKRPNLDFVLERFYNVIDFCDKKISELQKGIQFRDPLLPSHYIWDKKWSSKPKLRYFRKEINIGGKVKKAKAQLIGGNIARLFVNGQFVGEVKSRNSLSILPLKKAIQVFDITSLLKEGKNVLGIEANHYLRSIGSVNLYAQVSVLIPEGEGRTKEVVFQTNDTWKYCTDEKVSEKWATLDYSLKNAKVRWKNVKVVGTVPDINGDIYEPDLLKGEKSYASDIFGLAANIYYMVDLFVPTFLAKIIRFLSKPLFKLFK